MVSQLLTPGTVSVIEPGAVNTLPNQVNGSWLVQIVVSRVTVRSGLTATVNVLMVSQLLTPGTVSVTEPAAVNTLPNHVNGSWLVQIVVSRVTVSSGLTATVNVLMVSQLLTPGTVSVTEPAAVNTLPNQVNGSWLVQIVVSRVTVSSGLTATVNVLMVSQLLTPGTVSVTEPAAVNTLPNQVNGSWLVQIVVSRVTVSSGLTATVNVLMVSQLLTPGTVSVTEPAAVNTLPNHVNGSWLVQIVVSRVTVSSGLTATVNVLMVSQLLTPGTVSVTEPAAVNTLPNQVNGSWLVQIVVSRVTVSSGLTATVNVLMVSQLLTPGTVSVTEPAAVNTLPNHVNGSWLVQIVVSRVTVSSGLTATVNVLMVSQLLTPGTVSVTEPAAVNTLPNQVNGSWLVQIVVSRVTVSSGLTATVNVLMVSQLLTPGTVSVTEPAAVKTLPNQVNGSWLVQIVVSRVTVSSGLTATVNVLMVSQLLTPGTVSVTEPAAVNTLPNHVNGSWLVQIVVSRVTVSSGLTATVNVLMVSQLLTPGTVSVTEPAAVNTLPNQVNGSWLVQIVVSRVTVSSGLTATVNVLIVSQLLLPGTVSVTEPAAVNTLPNQVNGSWLVQIVVSRVTVSSGLTATVNVLIVSQLLLPGTVSVTEPAAVNTLPNHVNGSWLVQIVVSRVTVSSGSTATVNVLMVSQLLTPGTVSVTEPAAVNTLPNQVNGSWLVQIVVSRVTVSSGLTATVNVLMVSQLLTPGTVSVTEPAAVKTLPNQVNGSWLVQIVVSRVTVSSGLTATVNVLMVSQLLTPGTVSVTEPAAVNTLPNHVNGSWLVQIVVSRVTVSSGLTATVNVLMVSQLLTPGTVSVTEPAAVNTLPNQVNGSWLVQIVVSRVTVSSGLTATVNVLIVSQLLLPGTVSVTEPAAVKTLPNQVNGSWLVQIVVSRVTVSSGLTATVNVLIVSQLLLPGTVSVTEPAAVKTLPNHVNGSWLVQIVVSRVTVSSGLTATVNVLMVSQLLTPGTVSVTEPAAVKTLPNHVNGSWLVQIVVSRVTVRSGLTATVNVLMVSQLLTPGTVSVTEPAAVNTLPNHVNGSWLVQIVVSRVTVSSGLTATVNVLMVSQLLTPGTVSVTEPAAVNTLPNQVNGSWLVQIVVSRVTVSSGLTATVNVLMVSQLLTPGTVSVTEPAAVNTLPNQVNGSWLVQIVVSRVTVSSG